MASMIGTSSNESVESCGKQTREAIFRLQTLQRHDIYKCVEEKEKIHSARIIFETLKRENIQRQWHWFG